MREGRLIAPVTVLVMLVMCLVQGAAAADLSAPEPDADLKRLTRQATQLNKAYRGEIQSLEESRRAAKKATDRAGNLKKALADAEREVAGFATTTYMGGDLDGAMLLGAGGDAATLMAQAAVVSHLATERASRVGQIRTLIANAGTARKEAQEKVAELRKSIKTLQAKRASVEKLLAKFGFQEPGGTAGLTPRMVAVRDELQRNFPVLAVGCLRQGDPGDHGTGRACDFMMSGGGSIPTPEWMDRGNRMAQWCIDNGGRVGIAYVIWQQRYYDVRTGGGWRMMADRGGNTANHLDHVHVSVL